MCVCVLLLGEYCIEGIQGTIGNSSAWLAPKDTTIHSKSSFQVVFFESCKLKNHCSLEPPRKWCQGIADIAAEHARQMARGPWTAVPGVLSFFTVTDDATTTLLRPGEMPFSHDGFHDRVKRYPIPHLSAAEPLVQQGNSGESLPSSC